MTLSSNRHPRSGVPIEQPSFRQGAITMPKNGDINRELGVYKNFCCGSETLILAGDAFPACPNHLKLPTHWKRIVDPKRLASFFRVPVDRTVAFLPEGIRLERREEAYLIQ